MVTEKKGAALKAQEIVLEKTAKRSASNLLVADHGIQSVYLL